MNSLHAFTHVAEAPDCRSALPLKKVGSFDRRR